MSTEKSVSGLVTPEENLITQLAGYIHGGLPMQMTTLVGVLQLLERQTSEIISLNQQLSAKIISEQNIINAFCISGEDAHSKLVIEYVHGLVAENQFLKESYEDEMISALIQRQFTCRIRPPLSLRLKPANLMIWRKALWNMPLPLRQMSITYTKPSRRISLTVPPICALGGRDED